MLYNASMKGLKLSSCMFICTTFVCFDVKNPHLQLQCIYPFPPVIPIKNMKSPVSCDMLHLNLKSNWSVKSFLQNIFQAFLCQKTYVLQMRIFYETRFFLNSCPMLYLFLSICTHKFSDFPFPRKLYFLNFPVSKNIQSIGSPMYI